jgi:hypothetical protein
LTTLRLIANASLSVLFALASPTLVDAQTCPDISSSFDSVTDQPLINGIVGADSSCIVSDSTTYDACNAFVGLILDKTYQISDFQSDGGYMNTDAIANHLLTIGSASWTQLGDASDSSVLLQAQQDANAGKAVIAIGEQHVAMIMPSITMFWSPSWRECVPLSASHFLNNADANYVGKPLSKAWQLPAGTDKLGVPYTVVIYKHTP